jgi:hypothetical protein
MSAVLRVFAVETIVSATWRRVDADVSRSPSRRFNAGCKRRTCMVEHRLLARSRSLKRRRQLVDNVA